MADELILTISGEDRHLGDRDIPFAEKYTINCKQEGEVAVTETLDGVIQLRTYTAEANSEQQANIEMAGLSQGEHTLTITATVGEVSVTRTLTFTLPVTYLSPVAADLGEMGEKVAIPYMAKTFSGAELQITEKLDGRIHREYTAVSGETQEMTVNTEKLTDRQHTVEVIVTGDGETKSAKAVFRVAPVVLSDGGTVQELQGADGKPVYPATIAKAVMLSNGKSVEKEVANLDRVGDIKVTTRTDLGDDWLLCNGVIVSREVYEALGEVIPPNLLDVWGITNDMWANSSSTSIINCITYADGYWVVGGHYSTTARIAYTTDLAGTWTVKYLWSSSDATINCITYADGYWVVGGRDYDSSTYSARIAYTTDLAGTWTKKEPWNNSGVGTTINCITYADGYWVVGGQSHVGSTYNARIAYTTDLAGTWTAKTLWSGSGSGVGVDSAINCIEYADGYWVVCGELFSSSTKYARIAYTTDLAGTWTTKDLWSGRSEYNTLNCITYADGYWVVGGQCYYGGYNARIAYTTDLAGAWVTKDLWGGSISSINTRITCIAYVDGYWAVGGGVLRQ